MNKYFYSKEKVFFKMYQKGKDFRKDNAVKKLIGPMTYKVEVLMSAEPA